MQEPVAPPQMSPSLKTKPGLYQTRSFRADAGRSDRLLAAIIDGLIGTVFFALSLLLDMPSLFTYGLGLYWIYQLYLLTVDGQTIGKKVMKIKIVRIDTGENGGFMPNVLMRWLLNGLLALIPFYALVDILFIFREDRRCIHDMIAGTKVVRC